MREQLAQDRIERSHLEERILVLDHGGADITAKFTDGRRKLLLTEQRCTEMEHEKG